MNVRSKRVTSGDSEECEAADRMVLEKTKSKLLSPDNVLAIIERRYDLKKFRIKR